MAPFVGFQVGPGLIFRLISSFISDPGESAGSDYIADAEACFGRARTRHDIRHGSIDLIGNAQTRDGQRPSGMHSGFVVQLPAIIPAKGLSLDRGPPTENKDH